MPFLALDERQHTVADVRAGRAVENLEVVEDILTGFVPGSTGPSPDPLTREQIEEALDVSIVLAIAAPLAN